MKWPLALLFFSPALILAQTIGTAAPGCPNYNARKVLAAARTVTPGISIVSAHRGYWQYVPENTLEAVQAAVNACIEISEIDVRHISVSGQVSPPLLTTSVSSLYLQSNGDERARGQFLITNAGTVTPLTIQSISITSGDANNFAIYSNECKSPLAPGASCPVDVFLLHAETVLRNATLTIVSNDPFSPDTVGLSGVGSALRIQPLDIAMENNVSK